MSCLRLGSAWCLLGQYRRGLNIRDSSLSYCLILSLYAERTKHGLREDLVPTGNA